MSFSLYKALNKYKPQNTNEQDSLRRIIEFLSSNNNCFSRTNLEGHITAGALIIDENGNMLLNHHSSLDKWICFGGHSDGDEDSLNVAKREVMEECGLTEFDDLGGNIFDIDVHLIPENKSKNEPAHYHYDIRFLFVTNNKKIKISDESREIKWVTVQEARKLVSDEAILRMIEKAYKLYKYTKNKK